MLLSEFEDTLGGQQCGGKTLSRSIARNVSLEINYLNILFILFLKLFYGTI